MFGMSIFARVLRAIAPAVSSATHPFLKADTDTFTARSLPRPYEQSAWVRRAIGLKAEPLSQASLRFSTPTATGTADYRDPDLDAFWERPAIGPEGRLTRAEAFEATVVLLELSGHCYWIFDETWASGSVIPLARRTPFLIVGPGRIRVQYDSPDEGQVLGYWLKTTSGREFAVAPEQVEHLSYFSPYNQTGGSAPYLAARMPAEGDFFAGQFMRSLMMGNGDRGPIISPKNPEQRFDDIQREQIEASLLAKRRANLAGEFRPLFLGGAVDVQEPTIAAADSNFVGNRIEARKEIMAAFGIPASLAEPQATYSIGAASDYYRLIETACKPMGSRIAPHITHVSQRGLGMSGGGVDRLHASFDFSGFFVVQQAQEGKIDAYAKLLATGMPPVKAAAFLNLPFQRYAGDDQGTLPYSVVPVAQVFAKPDDATADPPALPEEKAGLPVLGGRLLRLCATPVARDIDAALTARVLLPSVVAKSDENEEARAALWRRLSKSRSAAEKRAEKVIGRALIVARAECLGKIGAKTVQRAEGEEEEADPRHPEDVLFNFEAFLKTLKDGLAREFRVNVEEGGIEARAEMGIDDPWTMAPAAVLKALEVRSPLIKGSAQDVFTDIKAALAEGFEKGDTTQQLADRVKTAFKGIGNGRAKTIAITETGAAYETGRAAGALDAGAKSKKWLSARDVRVRADHVAADGQHVGIEDFFTVGGELCRYPCGEGLSAKQACNCRCISQYLVEAAPKV